MIKLMRCLICGKELKVSWNIIPNSGIDLTYGAFSNETWEFDNVDGGKNIGHFKGCNTSHVVCNKCYNRSDFKDLLSQAYHDHHAKWDLQGIDNNYYPLTSDKSVKRRIESRIKLKEDIKTNYYNATHPLKIGQYVYFNLFQHLKVLKKLNDNKFVVKIVESR